MTNRLLTDDTITIRTKPRDVMRELKLARGALMCAAPGSRKWRALKLRVSALTLELSLTQPGPLNCGAL